MSCERHLTNRAPAALGWTKQLGAIREPCNPAVRKENDTSAETRHTVEMGYRQSRSDQPRFLRRHRLRSRCGHDGCPTRRDGLPCDLDTLLWSPVHRRCLHHRHHLLFRHRPREPSPRRNDRRTGKAGSKPLAPCCDTRPRENKTLSRATTNALYYYMVLVVFFHNNN